MYSRNWYYICIHSIRSELRYKNAFAISNDNNHISADVLSTIKTTRDFPTDVGSPTISTEFVLSSRVSPLSQVILLSQLFWCKSISLELDYTTRSV